jgi:predicted ester cyclase
MLFYDWLALWNGDYTRARDCISPDFTVHAALLGGGDGSAVRGPEGLVAWIEQTRAVFTELVFDVDVGPITEDDLLAVRWLATGVYGGGFPGSTAPVGTPVRFTGTDTLRFRRGRIAEYWVNSDVHVLLAQLGALNRCAG